MASTAAPTAPSTGAPSVQPVPASESGAAAPHTPPAQDATAAPPARKPLKPIPTLPGVVPDDAFPNFGLPPEAGPSTGSTPARGADGRFLPGASAPPAQDAAGDHTGDSAPGRFVFGGVQFASREAAEQNFRSLRGEHKPIMGLAKQLGGIDKIAPTLTRASESARAWKSHAESLEAELAAYRQGGQPAGRSAPAPAAAQAAPSSPEGEAAADAGIDWALYAEIRKLANESGEPWKAEQWLIEETRKAERTRYEQLLDERLAPFDAERQKAGVVAQTEALFGQLAEFAFPDGSPAFPELHDESAAYEIGRLWASLGLPKEAAMTPQGAAAAIALYRMQRAGRPLPAPAQPAAGPHAAAPAPPAPSAPSDAAAAAAVADGRTRQFELPGQGGHSAEAARILQGLRNTNAGNRSVLGFDP